MYLIIKFYKFLMDFFTPPQQKKKKKRKEIPVSALFTPLFILGKSDIHDCQPLVVSRVIHFKWSELSLSLCVAMMEDRVHF